MKKTILYIAISLDGYIADRNGGVDWLEGEEPGYVGDYGYEDFIKNIDTVVMGMKTYRQIATELSPDRWMYQGLKTYVLTHQKHQNTEEVEFTGEPVAALMQRLKNEPGKQIWICGGADIVNQLVLMNEIDEYHLAIIPVLLGGGTRLFQEQKDAVPLHLVESRSENGLLMCKYTRR